MAALVVLPRDADEAGIAMGAGRGPQRCRAAVGRRQARRDSLEHPGAAQVQAVDVGQLGVGAVGDQARPQPGRGTILGQPRQEACQPRGEGRWGEYAPEEVGFGQAR